MRNKLIILILVLAISLLLPDLSHSQAGFIGDLATAVIGKIFFAIAYLIGVLGGILFALAGVFVNLMLGLNYRILGDENVLIYTGWSIVRDIANLGFVLAIIIIALATVVRWQEYSVQKLLPRLIAAAIIVNFSLTLAGVFIDFGNVLTAFFFEKVSLNPLKLADTLAGAFNPQRLLEVKNQNIEGALGAIGNFGEAIINGIMTLIFTAVFTIAGALTLLLYAVLLFLRFLWLTFLIIIAPIVWLFWVIPALTHHFKEWWDKFFKWVFFAPASAFFIYLALLTAQTMREGEAMVFGTAAKAEGFILGTLIDVFNRGAQMVVLIGIMIGGLIVAEKIGIEGAKAVSGFGQKLGKGITKGVGGWSVGGGAEKLQQLGSKGGALTKTLTAPARWTGKALSGIGKGVGIFTGARPGFDEKGKPLSLWGSALQSTRKEFKKKKKKLTPGEIAEGEAEIPEEGEGEEGKPRKQPKKTYKPTPEDIAAVSPASEKEREELEKFGEPGPGTKHSTE